LRLRQAGSHAHGRLSVLLRVWQLQNPATPAPVTAVVSVRLAR